MSSHNWKDGEIIDGQNEKGDNFKINIRSVWDVDNTVYNEYISTKKQPKIVSKTESYKAKQTDSFMIIKVETGNALFEHATLLIKTKDNNIYSIGFNGKSLKDKKLCMESPDVLGIGQFRKWSNNTKKSTEFNKDFQGLLIKNDSIILKSDSMSAESVKKLNSFINLKRVTPYLYTRRPIINVCSSNHNYIFILSRIRQGYNCWSALEEIFPEVTIPKACILRGGKNNNKKTLRKLGSRSKTFKSNGNVLKTQIIYN